MHTNHNSVCLININLIIMKVIPQPAHDMLLLCLIFKSGSIVSLLQWKIV